MVSNCRHITQVVIFLLEIKMGVYELFFKVLLLEIIAIAGAGVVLAFVACIIISLLLFIDGWINY